MTHVHTENKHFQLLETVVSLAHICMQPSVYLGRAGGNLSPRHMLLQAANLLLQVTNCLLPLCCLCRQLRLQSELLKLKDVQRPLSTIKCLCKTRSVMLLQYIHDNTSGHEQLITALAIPKCCQAATAAVCFQFLHQGDSAQDATCHLWYFEHFWYF